MIFGAMMRKLNKDKSYCSFIFNMTVPFFDVDSMAIVWHGHYVKYLEVARCAFLSAMHYDYEVMRAQGFGWPVVQLALKYVRPARFGQDIVIETRLMEYETYLKLDYEIRDQVSGEILTQASTTQVAVAMDSGETQWQTPESWQQAVKAYLATFQATSKCVPN